MRFKLLVNYLTDELSLGERDLVEDWIKSDPRNELFIDSLKRIWKVEPDDQIKVDAKKAWIKFRRDVVKNNKVVGEIPNSEDPSNKILASFEKRYKGRSHFFSYLIATAAVVLLAFIFVVNIHFQSSDSNNTIAKVKEYVAAPGEITRISLSDGTSVHLNVDSRLRVSSEFDKKRRTVFLEGEAYFDVTSNQHKPFLVKTAKSVTRVLGTRFNISAYPDAHETSVIVEEGKVAFGTGKKWVDQNIHLVHNQKGILSNDGRLIVSDISDIKNYTAWRDGTLIFKDAPFSEVERQLERWFDVEINTKDGVITTQRLTASFRKEPITEVLDVVVLALGAKYKMDGNEISISSSN